MQKSKLNLESDSVGKRSWIQKAYLKFRVRYFENPKRQVSFFVKVLLFLHVVAITSWALPTPAPGVANGNVPAAFPSEWLLYMNDKYVKHSPVQLYVLSTGLWQSWDMFSPNPANTDIWADADVYFKNGTKTTYQYPRMYILNRWDKYRMERYRKFYEHANDETQAYLWMPFAQEVARLAQTDPSNPAVKVVLKRHYYIIPPPITFAEYCHNLWQAAGKGDLSTDVLCPPSPSIPPYQSYAYFSYDAVKGTGRSL